jgi:4-hydroxyacetophenone monooxygenase
MQSDRNPHAGAPFDDDDASIARVLQDVSIPALMCSLVHITGDPSWIRGEIRPVGSALNEYQGYMTEEMRAEIRQRALPVIAAFRDNNCELPPPPSPELVHEMMSFLACAPVSADVVPMFLEDLHLDGSDAGAITWGDEIPAEVKADAHVVVIGCGEAGLLGRHPSVPSGPCRSRSSRRTPGPGGTWWDNRYPGARVDIGSHFYCYSFEPGLTTGPSTSRSIPNCATTSNA